MQRHSQILREHKELHGHLSRVHRILAERQLSGAALASELDTLKSQLVAHFSEEERDDGFFVQLVEWAPYLDAPVQLLRQEHREALEQLEGIAREARWGTPSPSWWDHLERQFHEFSCQLMNHEHRENRLLQEASGMEIGPGD